MGGDFLVPLHLIFMVNIITACLPREYRINNVCCPMCDKGSFVKSHCTKELSSSVCVICADTTYMDHPNGLTECFRCKECDSGANLVVKQKCTETSNTVCECSAGHFCKSQECDMCQVYTECQPGHYVKKPGTPVTNTECDECPKGHYSDRNNAAQCYPRTNCVELGQILYKEGNSTADSICKEKRSRFLLAVAFVPLLAVIIYVVTGFSIGKPEMTTPDVQDGGGYRDPQQEEHTQSPVSETLPKHQWKITLSKPLQ
ncbi:tumor necrosis factor receptor superfamily member 14 isoform X2 [Ranitomeya imitator]|uniref:tumor necrosis factor receptor superfamily member 14 isoform X2 n=1 Tax=Ranitomeya imitator TaxID=111125 RepID=UPI0037E98EAE